MNRKWSEWREKFNEIQESKGSYEAFAAHLEQAQQIVEHYGNPTGRYYSYVNKLKELLNKVNRWRMEVHEYFFKTPVLDGAELAALLKRVPPSCPPCKEMAMIQAILDKKERIEAQIRDAYGRHGC